MDAKPTPIDRIKALIRAHPRIALAVVFALFVFITFEGYHFWLNRTRLILYGNVDIREVNLGFRVSGKLLSVLKDEGDAVKQGDLLATLDQTPNRHDVEEARADTEVKEAAQASAEANFKRAQSLAGTKAISQEELDNFRSTRDQAVANLDLAKARLDSATTKLQDTQLVCPSDGVIITRAQEPGTILNNGSTVLTLSLEKPVWVRAYVHEPDLGHVYTGQQVEILTDTPHETPYIGQIGYISPRAEFTPKSVETKELRTSLVYRLRVTVTNPDPGLRQGMPVTLRIQLK